MNILTLSIASIKSRKLPSFLCVMAVACGIALLVSVLLLFSAAEKGLMKNAQGVDIVVGAKGSPLQLVFSTMYHGDIPTGNIEMHDLEQIGKNPNVKTAIPLAIGDNYKGYRVVGTTQDYPQLYKASVQNGKMFKDLYEVTVGAGVDVKIGEEFAARHGFSADSDDVHDAHLYKVVGKLKPTGTVLDKLLLTPYQSVQDLHSHHEEHEEGHHDDDEDEAEELALGHQITAILIKVKTPAALMNLPRQINKNEHVMAVSPSHVMARFMKSTGMGRDMVMVLGCVFLTLATLMLLSVLASGLAQRKYDLAVLRVLGAAPSLLAGTVMIEGLILSFLGALAGVILGHGIAYFIALSLPALHSLFLPASLLSAHHADIVFIAIGTVCGALAGIVPCWQAARTDAATILATGR